MMALVVRVSGDDTFSFIVSDAVTAAWRMQLDRGRVLAAGLSLQDVAEMHFVASLTHSLDGDLKPPTESQLAYAITISRELAVVLPVEALRHRSATSEFIARYVDVFKDRRRRPVPRAPQELEDE
jgi:hypothetical protein